MFNNTLLAAESGGGIMMIVLIGVMVLFFVLSFRSQKKQERQANEMRNSLMVGDEITTIGGIIGKIVSIKEETMVIETTRDHTRIRLLKSAVRSVDVRVEDTRAPKAEEKVEEQAEQPVAEAVEQPAKKADKKKTKAESNDKN